jgi:hypothetical protein
MPGKPMNGRSAPLGLKLVSLLPGCSGKPYQRIKWEKPRKIAFPDAAQFHHPDFAMSGCQRMIAGISLTKIVPWGTSLGNECQNDWFRLINIRAHPAIHHCARLLGSN